MKTSVALTAAFLALATPALAQPAPMMGPMSAEQYRQMAMISDTFEIESSRLALDRSRNPAIRRFASMMVSDHGQTSAALGGRTMAGGVAGGAATGAAAGGAVAGPVGAAVGAGAGAVAGAAGAVTGAGRYSAGPMLDARHADMLNQLAAARRAQFDRLYATMQVQAHEEALALHSGYAQNGYDPALRGFAAQAAPVIQEHRDMALRLPGARSRRG